MNQLFRDSSLGIQRALHDAVGGFDELLPFHHDADYCFRIQLSGVALQFVPDAVLHYRARQTLWGTFRQATRWAEYNVLIYRRYRPLGARELWRWRWYTRRWGELLSSLRNVRSRPAFAALVWSLGWQVGRLKGSIRFGVPPV